MYVNLYDTSRQFNGSSSSQAGLCRAGGRSTPTLTSLLVNQPADPAASERVLLELEGALALADTTDTSVVNVNQCFLASAGMLPHRRMRGCRTAARLPDSGGGRWERSQRTCLTSHCHMLTIHVVIVGWRRASLPALLRNYFSCFCV